VAGERGGRQSRVRVDLGRPERALEDDLAVVERAQVEGDRPGIDAGDARAAVRRGAQASCSFAIS
jgi:hypothetical protein